MTAHTNPIPIPPRSQSEPPANYEARNTRVIWLLLAASFVVILNETIMSVAIPELMHDLKIDERAAQWLTTVFMLTMAIVIPITGFLLQRFNTRPVFIAAMTLFSSGTLIAALAPGFSVLLIARVVQASGTAIMMPLLMTTVMTLVPAAIRGKTMGNISIVISVAPAIGPTISGAILTTLSWRWMFWLVLPIALTMLFIGYKLVKNVSETRKIPLDVTSVVLSAFGFGGLIYGLSLVGSNTSGTAVGTWILWGSFGIGTVSLITFVLRQLRLQRDDRALLDLRTFKSSIFSASIITMSISMFALFGTIILLPIYLQQVLGLLPVQVGLLLLPGGLVMGLLALAVGRLYDKFGPRPLVVPGSILVSSVFWVLSTVTENTPVALVLSAHIALSIGLSLLFTPLFSSGLGSVRPSLYSHASATVGTIQQVSGAIGAATFITVMSIQTVALSASDNANALSADVAAVASGVGSAFLVGAIISTGAIISSIFVRKPADVIEDF